MVDTNQQWHNTLSDGSSYMISPARHLLSKSFIYDAFSLDELYWATAPSPPAMETMIDNSWTFGLYLQSPTPINSTSPYSSPSQSSLEQIGMARLVADLTTFAYLTDVYILPAHRGKDLGKWLITCVKEWCDTFPYLRSVILLTSGGQPDQSVEGNIRQKIRFYEENLGAEVLHSQSGFVAMKTPKKKRDGMRCDGRSWGI
ncbi:MAG: hypothetical protein M1820_001438 [Bogoriella megaspora]|nr:MAG: hypothetical protein M1820_001438 [Bogoriella megaspora]